MRPSIRQLEYLVAVARTLNFRQAAEECYVTQPALSTQLQQLENQLGLQLFERDRRKVLPTPAGRAIVEQARTILQLTDELVDCAKSYHEPLSGSLRLGVIPTVSPYFLPVVLDDVRHNYTDLRLLLYEDQTGRLLQRLAEGRLDVLVLALDVDLGDCKTMPLFEDCFMLVTPANHPLAQKKNITQDDLKDQEVLLLEDGHCLRDQALPLCTSASAKEVDDFRASSLSTLVQMVASGIGVTFLPKMAVSVEAASNKKLAVRDFENSSHCRQIGLAWRASSTRSKEFELLGQKLQQIWQANS